MSVVASPASDVRDTERQSAELAAMRRMIEASSGTFSLSISVCNSPALRDYLLEQLRLAFPTAAIVAIPAGTVDVYGHVVSQAIASPPAALSIVGLESSIRTEDESPLHPTPPTRQTLRSLNAARELWESRFACPVVLWLPEYAARLLSVEARDLWRYVSHHFEFVAEQAGAMAAMSDRFTGDLNAAGNLSAVEKRFRIAELEQRLADAGPDPTRSLLPHVALWLSELGFLYFTVGELDRAEEMFREALAINEKSGRHDGVANQYANLGQIYRSRGQLDRAEEMHRKSLALNEKLDRQEGIANQLSNMGLIYYRRGELDRAEETIGKAMTIFEKLGREDGMAVQYSTLGLIYRRRGELDRAENLHHKALVIDERLGRQEGVASEYANLGLICRRRGDLRRAEILQRRALEICEKLGRTDGIARAYANLAAIADQRGDYAEGRDLWMKARDLFAKIGVPLWINSSPEPMTSPDEATSE